MNGKENPSSNSRILQVKIPKGSAIQTKDLKDYIQQRNPTANCYVVRKPHTNVLLVIFNKDQDASDALTWSDVNVKGTKLSLKRAPAPYFTDVQTKVAPQWSEKLLADEARLEEIKRGCGVSLDVKDGIITCHGNFYQIKEFHRLIDFKLGENDTTSPSSLGESFIQVETKPFNLDNLEEFNPLMVTGEKKTEPKAMESLELNESNEDMFPGSRSKLKEVTPRTPQPSLEEQIVVDKRIFSYLGRAYQHNLSKIENEYRVLFKPTAMDESFIHIEVEHKEKERGVDASKLAAAKDDYVHLYHDVYEKVVSDSVLVPEEMDRAQIISFVDEVLRHHPSVYLEQCKDDNKIILVGRPVEVLLAKRKMEEMIQELYPNFCEREMAKKFDETATKAGTPPKEQEPFNPEVPLETANPKFISQVLSCEVDDDVLTVVTKSEMVVSVHVGNIIEADTECIVNAANAYLAHAGGVAAAIAEAAGPELYRECAQWLEERGPLSISEVIDTTGGQMRPKVLHAVGPQLRHCPDDAQRFKLLKLTFINCLKKADSLNLKSISMPAISSGLFGIPLEEVSKAIFDAIMYVTKRQVRDGRYQNIKEVHIVDLELDSIKIIQDVFKNKCLIDPPNETATKRVANMERAIRELCEGGDFRTQVIINELLEEQARIQEDEERHREAARQAERQHHHHRPAPGGKSREPAVALLLEHEPRPSPSPATKSPVKTTFAQTKSASHRTATTPTAPKEQQPFMPSAGSSMPSHIVSGTMVVDIDERFLPGYKGSKTMVVKLKIPDGTQPVGGYSSTMREYKGTRLTTYLPDNREGRDILRLLEQAMEAGVLFTVQRPLGGSVDRVQLNGIDLKTNVYGDNGFPDVGYIPRLKRSLLALGIGGR